MGKALTSDGIFLPAKRSSAFGREFQAVDWISAVMITPLVLKSFRGSMDRFRSASSFCNGFGLRRPLILPECGTTKGGP